jgi:hypothetical protein
VVALTAAGSAQSLDLAALVAVVALTAAGTVDTLARVRSTRVLVERLSVGDDDVAADEIAYADVFVVVRDGESAPGPSDWEVTLQTSSGHRLRPGGHDLRLDAHDGSRLEGRALLRFSDGTRHLFRGDGHLAGFDPTP